MDLRDQPQPAVGSKYVHERELGPGGMAQDLRHEWPVALEPRRFRRHYLPEWLGLDPGFGALRKDPRLR